MCDMCGSLCLSAICSASIRLVAAVAGIMASSRSARISMLDVRVLLSAVAVRRADAWRHRVAHGRLTVLLRCVSPAHSLLLLRNPAAVICVTMVGIRHTTCVCIPSVPSRHVRHLLFTIRDYLYGSSLLDALARARHRTGHALRVVRRIDVEVETERQQYAATIRH